MMFRIPDWLRYEIGHHIERGRDTVKTLRIKERINEHPRISLIIAVAFVLLFSNAIIQLLNRPPKPPRPESKKAWFYDLNTGELFVARGKLTGPIDAPSGPLPNGEPAGVRAHVYSYRSDPNEAERFVGFLEKADPNANVDELRPDRSDYKAWARGRLIRRVGGDEWISPMSQRGRRIVLDLEHPDMYGKVPIYQTPR